MTTEDNRTGTAGYGQAPDADGTDVAQVQTASGLNILVGLWLVIAPWVLDYSEQSNAVWNQVGVGVVIAALASFRVFAPRQWASLSWINFVLGLWLIIAPFVLTYNETGNTQAILWNDIISGLLVLSLAAWSAVATSRSSSRR